MAKTLQRTPSRGHDPGAAGGWFSAIGFLLAAGAVILAAYLAHPIVQGHRLPIGPDGPVYTWWTAQGAVDGLGAIPARPGVPAASIVLGAIFGTEPVQTVSLLGPLLAAACGLAAAGLLESALGRSPARAWAGAGLAAGFSAYLATGWLANLAQALLFLAAIAALGLARRSWPSVALGAALLTTGMIAHPPFHLVGLAILAGGIAAQIPEARRELAAGVSLRDTWAGRLAIGSLAGTAAGGAAVLSVGGAPPGDTSQDAFLRRAGLDDALRREYRFRLREDARRGSAHLGAGLILSLLGVRERWGEGARFFLGVLGSWLVITVGGIAVLAATTWGPAHRLLSFAFFLPLAGAVGLTAGLARGRLLRVGVIAAGLLFVSGSMYAWYRAEPFMDREELTVAGTAGAVVERLPAGTPVVFLVDTAEPAASFHVTRFGNVIRAGMPADRIGDVRLAIGRPADYLSGVPTLTGDREHDELSRIALRDLGEIRRRAVTFLLEPFNEEGYVAAGFTSVRQVGPGVKVLGDPPDLRAGTTIGPRATDPGLGAGGLIGLSIAALLLLAALGGGWAAWGLPGLHPRAVAALAPAVGLGVAILAGFVADRFGAGDSWGALVAGLIASIGYLVARGRGAARTGP